MACTAITGKDPAEPCFKSTEVNEIAVGYGMDKLPGCNPTAYTKDEIGKNCDDNEVPQLWVACLPKSSVQFKRD